MKPDELEREMFFEALSAIADTLAQMVVSSSTSLADVDEFARVFQIELRERWLRLQPSATRDSN